MFNLFRSVKARAKERAEARATIERLYGAIVAQSRRSAFYADFGVPDTVEGRFEMVLLHTFLVCHRLKGAGEAAGRLSQEIFDAFADDMDRTLREMGVGDLSVPKKMKKIGEAFYGRTAAYDAALAEPRDDALAAALGRNILDMDAATDDAHPRALAAYVRSAVAALAATPFETLAGGRLDLPAPEAMRG